MLAFLIGVGYSQAPDVRFHLDLDATYYGAGSGPVSLRLYDPLGHASTLQIEANIDQGIRAYLSERIQQFPNDPSKDPLEQYYVEDPGTWRLGKQYLPFGSGNIVRENVLAAEGETKLLFENTSLQMAAFDGGSGNQRGFIGRLGGRIGVSAAIGNRLGISPTSFDLVRSPEASPGSGRGWKQMLDIDASRRFGQFTTAGEIVWMQKGETQLDRNGSVWDINEVYQPDRTHSYLAGFSHGSLDDSNFFRLTAHVPWTKSTAIEPLLRYRNGRFYDLALTLRVRL